MEQMNDNEFDDFPPIVPIAELWDNLPELAPPLIDGVLRQGHKMLIAGPSKAGKSYALIELCCAIAEGKKWLGFPCAQGRVLYVNLELDRASCLHRFRDIYEALGWQPRCIGNIDIWNLRGNAMPLNELAPKIIQRARGKGYIAISIDPIYKVLTGNENNNSDMSKFVSHFDHIASELNTALIYCHHHSKGDQSWKRPIDRNSGAGVFGRDPDAILDVIELELPPERRIYDISAWRITGILREFLPFPPVDVWFNYPIHVVEHFDSKEIIAPHHELPSWKRAMNGRDTKEEKLRKRQHRLEAAYDICSTHGSVTISSMSDYLDVSTQTVRNLVDQHPNFIREKGIIFRK